MLKYRESSIKPLSLLNPFSNKNPSETHFFITTHPLSNKPPPSFGEPDSFCNQAPESLINPLTSSLVAASFIKARKNT